MNEHTERLSGQDFKQMMEGAYQALTRQHEEINSLNVFPVPDGDTGTNMLLTMRAGMKGLAETDDMTIGFVSKRLADSAILGARGNSGVIFSQIFRGIAKGLSGKITASSGDVGKAFQYGILYAYRAVAKPVEGTILTVAKAMAKGSHHAIRQHKSFPYVLTEAISAGEEALRQTPELLPALKEAGVVDAGGRGLLCFLQGCLDGLTGEFSGPEAGFDEQLAPMLPFEIEPISITRPYCTEFIVKHYQGSLKDVKKNLLALGDSLVLAEGSDFLKVHIHSANPGQVLEIALTWGTLHDIKIDNMADQHQNKLLGKAEKAIGIIAVAQGDGLAQLLQNLGAEKIILGGQTMNPSVEQIVDAVHCGTAEKYILLPNNKNIILAANQAKKLLGDRLEVVMTRTVTQGLAALLAFDPDKKLNENLSIMNEAAQKVKEGSLTKAVRNSQVDHFVIQEGDYLGLAGGKVRFVSSELKETLLQTLAQLITAEDSLGTLYTGADLTAEELGSLMEALQKEYPDLEWESYAGGQPLYPIIFTLE